MEAWGSQVIGRGGCGCGLLGHECACKRVLVCMLGCLSNLEVVQILQGENIPSCSGKNKGQFSAPPPNPSSSFPLSRSLKAEGETLYPDEGLRHFSAESCWLAFGEEAILQLALFLHYPLPLCIVHLLLPPGL